MGLINRRSTAQRERDRSGRRDICAACGRPATTADRLRLVDGGRIHTSHLTDPRSGYYRAR
ncbi:MAG TPA: hypothetical protein VFX70_11790 [Mycobacteriales bacterium]|nr:hypothetical protein [Mycobacteriales bacterium]